MNILQTNQTNFSLIPMSEISDAARELAVAWVENFKPTGGLEIQQKHKLASDIQNLINAAVKQWQV